MGIGKGLTIYFMGFIIGLAIALKVSLLIIMPASILAGVVVQQLTKTPRG